MRVNIGFPVVRTDGPAYGHVITRFVGWVDYHISLAMGRSAKRARGRNSAIMQFVDKLSSSFTVPTTDSQEADPVQPALVENGG